MERSVAPEAEGCPQRLCSSIRGSLCSKAEARREPRCRFFLGSRCLPVALPGAQRRQQLGTKAVPGATGSGVILGFGLEPPWKLVLREDPESPKHSWETRRVNLMLPARPGM